MANDARADLLEIRDNLLTKLKEMSANPKPNYSIDGQQVSWQGLYDSLWKSLGEVNARLADFDDAGPFEVQSQGYT